MIDDMELVRHYAADKSDSVFAALVERHVHLVYSAALRQVGDPHRAEEITQTVFIILARKASSFSSQTILSGWLYRTTRFAASAALKSDLRRQQREQEAYMDSILHDASAESWEHLSPILDEAMAQLRSKDRDVIVLRFFENKTFQEMGAALGIEERAAQKRTLRSLEKLRAVFARRGVALTSVVLGSALAANSVQAAPATLATTITSTAATGSAVGASTLTLVKGTLNIMNWIKLKLALGAAAVILLAGGTLTVALSENKTPAAVTAAETLAQDRSLLNQMLDATAKQDFKAFMAPGDSALKQLTKADFKSVADQIGNRLKAGYDLVYFGELQQQGYRCTVWKVAFKDRGDDAVTQISVKDGKVGAIWIQ